MAEASIYFKTEIMDSYVHALQTGGSLLMGTARRGDVKAKTVEFPIIMKSNQVRKLTGALSEVVKTTGGFDKATVDMDDYETDPRFIFTPDLEKLSPNLKQGLKESLQMDVGRKHDMLQWNALAAYTADAASDFGAAGDTIDPIMFSEAKASIGATGGMRPGMIFAGLPSMQMEQMKLYREFNNADYTGPDLPFTKASTEKKTWNGINFIVLPDEYFSGPDGNNWYSYLWQADCIGVESNWGDLPTVWQDPNMQGNPWAIKIGFGGAAVGILRDGVKRLIFKKQTSLSRIPVLTKAAA